MTAAPTQEARRGVERTMLALAIWREARGEPLIAKAGVACSILNRVQRPSWWGRDVLSVLSKRWQYSSLTDPKDPQLTTWPTWQSPAWQECLEVADAALRGRVFNPVPHADSYFDVSIPAPSWATPDLFVAQLGRLRFYNVDRDVEADAPAAPQEQ